MNLTVKVWLPPDGDSRLVRYQGEAAASAGFPGLMSIPPYLELQPQDRVLSGPVTPGSWKLDRESPVLEAFDALGPAGVFRMGLVPGRRWKEADLGELPAAPCWIWTRGRLAWLTIEENASQGTVILWSWKPLSGWKAAPPKG